MITRHLPSSVYNGLTIILSNPSRFDKDSLISGTAGVFFEKDCLKGIRREECDIRLSTETRGLGLLDNTSSILLLGEKALHEWADTDYKSYTLNEQRGCPLKHQFDPSIRMICGYQPQDALDITGKYEKENNQYLVDEAEEDDDDNEEGEESENATKRKGKTKRKNWRFWLTRDTRKIINALRHPEETTLLQRYDSRLYPSAAELIQLLTTTKNEYLYLDIETTSELEISVIGLGFSNSNVIYSIPIIRWDYVFAYPKLELSRIFYALCVAFENNTVVCHNSMFDLFVLAYKYKIRIGTKNEDTMLMWHRAFPEADKSLGHLVSTLTNEPYHKDEGIFNPHNSSQEQSLWKYNIKDVWTTRLCHQALIAYSKTQPGLEESMKQANSMIRPYLINTLLGLRVDESRRLEMLALNDRKLTQYYRIIKTLIGDECEDAIRPSKSEAILPTSPKQCVKYFHEIMGYPVAGRSRITGKPSLDEKNFYKLALKLKDKGIDNPVATLVLYYRGVAKESGVLKFNSWKD